MFNPLRALRERLEKMTQLRPRKAKREDDSKKLTSGRYIESELVVAFEKFKEKQNEKENL